MIPTLGFSLALLCSSATAGPAQNDEQGKGLWHAYGSHDVGTLFFFVYNGSQSKVYGPDWQRVSTDLVIEDGAISFELPQGHYKHQVKARFVDGVLSGTYERPHPQYPWKGDFHSRQVNNDPDWDPWTFLGEAKSSVINPWATILEEAPRQDLEAFKAYWADNVERRYYALLTHSLYANEAVFFLPDLRQKAIEDVFAIVKAQDPALKELAGQFKETATSVFQDLRKLYPWMRIPGIVFPFLSQRDSDFQIRVVDSRGSDNRPFLLFNLEWMTDKLNPTQVRYVIAHGLLAFEHESRHAIGRFVRNQVNTRGVAAYLASRLDYSQSPVDYLFQVEGASQEERLKAFRQFGKAFSRSFKGRISQAPVDFFQGEYRAPAYLFAYGFMSKMAERFGDQRLAQQFDYDRLTDELAAYMNGLKTLPDPAKPQANHNNQAQQPRD